jgi:hypothetical protein
MVKRKMRSIFFAAIITLTACMARAVPVGTVEIEHTGFGAGGLLRVSGGGLYGSCVRGGIYMLDKTDSTGEGDLWPDGLLGGLCIELSQQAPKKPSEYDVVMPQDSPEPTCFLGGHIGLDKAEYLSELWGRFFEPNWVGEGPFTYRQKMDAEAFAAAVWEIIYEELPESPANWNVKVDGTFGRLGFRCFGVDTFTANSWLHALDGTGPKADLRALVYCGKQDYIVAIPSTKVPEPTTMVLMGFGTLVLIRKKKFVQHSEE